MAGIAEGRLREERRSWRKDHPIGRPRPRQGDGSTDLLNWDVRPRRFNSHHTPSPRPHLAQVVIPGKKYDVGRLRVQPHYEFSSDYPATAPVVKFVSRARSELCGSTPSSRRSYGEDIARWRGAPEI